MRAAVSTAPRLATATLFAGAVLLAVPLASATIEAHTGRPTRGDRALVRVESGARLPEALRSGSRNLFGDWWRVPISAERSSTAELTRLAAFSGIMLSARIMSGTPTAAQGWELEIIAAVIIGGTSLAGGSGTVWGTLIGVLFIGVLANGMTLLNVPSYTQYVVRGLLIFAAVLLNRVQVPKE